MTLRECMRGIGKGLAVFATTALILAAALLGSALIPRSAIKQHVLESAEYLCQDEMFFEVVGGVAGSKIDRYADSILLGIAWQYDAQDPVRSVMASSFFHESSGHENQGLLQAVTKNLSANQEYSRYWHGSISLVRPLLTLLPLQGIYALNAMIMVLLAVLLLARLWRRHAWAPLAGMAIALVGTTCWFVPFSLEYTWMPLVMLVQLHGVLCKRFFRHLENRALFYLASGMVTSYMDFLTTELLTLLVPLALMIWRDHDENDKLPAVGKTALWAIAWFVGYAGMWALKWLLSGVVLGSNLQQTVGFHVLNRSGSLATSTASQQLEGAVTRNLSCLFPWEYGTPGVAAGTMFVLAALCMGLFFRRSGTNWRMVICYTILALVPFARFLVLNNHAFIHYFFTYRVLAATLFALTLALGEIVCEGVSHVAKDSL